jgi:hypothetical protein
VCADGLKCAAAVDDSKAVMDFRRPALAFVFLSLGYTAGCGANRGHATARPGPAVPPSAESPATVSLRQATQAEAAGHASDALSLYETVAATDAPGADRLLAHISAARIRLSTNPAVRDLSKAREHLADVSKVNPTQPATIPASDLVALLDDATQLATVKEQQDQRTTALRGENRTLKNTIKALQEELARKDEALHRATEKLLEKAPPPH